MSLVEDGGNFGHSEPCRVKHPQMSLGVTTLRGVHYRALPGEGVFLVNDVIGSNKVVMRCLSVTS